MRSVGSKTGAKSSQTSGRIQGFHFRSGNYILQQLEKFHLKSAGTRSVNDHKGVYHL
jgi:hypothetical protein